MPNFQTLQYNERSGTFNENGSHWGNSITSVISQLCSLSIIGQTKNDYLKLRSCKPRDVIYYNGEIKSL